MSLFESLYHAGEYFAAGLFEEPARGLFYRKALGLRRYFETAALPPYTGGHLYPSGGQHFDTNLFPHYLTGFKMNREALDEKVPGASAAIDSEFDRYHTSVPWEHSVAGNMYTHSMPNYARIAAEGFESYLPRIEKIADADLRGGLSHLLAGIRTYVKRCADYLQSAGADQALIDALRRLPFMPARTIYEAIVCRNFLFYLDNCDNLGCVASDLMPYYNGEDVTELLCELFDNCDITGGYSMSLGVDYSPLTVQCLRAVKGKRRPMMELFIDENCPDEVWDAALDAVRSSGGQPAFYSYRGVIGGLHRRFPQIPQADLDRFCGGGCTESMLAGLSNVGSLDAGINLPLILT